MIFGKVITAIGVACGIILLVMVLISITAGATSGPEWIDRGNFRNPVTGDLCCGKYDCFEVNGKFVRYDATAQKFHVDWRGRDQVVAESEALVSKDEFYHLCQNPNGTIRCFFRPVVGT